MQSQAALALSLSLGRLYLYQNAGRRTDSGTQ